MSEKRRVISKFGPLYIETPTPTKIKVYDSRRKRINCILVPDVSTFIKDLETATTVESLVSLITECDWLSDNWKDLANGVGMEDYFNSEEELLANDWVFCIGNHLFYVPENTI